VTTRFNRRDLLKKSAAATGAVAGMRMFAAPAILAERSPNAKLGAAPP
jgi:phosphodiesterase/alkaline phosphatase D-like protein